MATVFEKLNRKDQQEIVVLNAPASFEPEMAKLPVKTRVVTRLDAGVEHAA